eukprot:scaffold14199_cov118-Isochrysis_galbana.AAC.5
MSSECMRAVMRNEAPKPAPESRLPVICSNARRRTERRAGATFKRVTVCIQRVWEPAGMVQHTHRISARVKLARRGVGAAAPSPAPALGALLCRPCAA